MNKPQIDKDENSGGGLWFFRALTIDGKRKALRLERSFWAAIEQLSSEANQTQAEFISTALSVADAKANATSAVRQHVLRQILQSENRMKSMLSIDAVRNLINACPGPAIALSEQRRLQLTNPPFLRFLRISLPNEIPQDATAGVQLQIDMQMEDLFRRLEEGTGQPVSVGFALGINDRRVRGRMNAVLAPCGSERMILGYIVT